MSNRAEIKRIKAIILASQRDFGRCLLASRLPMALWPIAEKSVLEHLLSHLAEQGIKHVVVCSSGEGSLLAESICPDSRLEIEFLDESLPMGTAGCIREAQRDGDELLLVFPASLVCPPEIETLIDVHHEGQSDLTVIFSSCNEDSTKSGQALGIYVCNPDLLKHIPKQGYVDIKEGLIPEILRVGKSVHAAILPNQTINFRDRQGYLYAVSNYLESILKLNRTSKHRNNISSQAVWIASTAKVDPEAKIYGPVVVMDDATISNGAVVLGPAVIGKNATVNNDSVVIKSVLWDGATVGSNCSIRRCVVDYHAFVRSNSVVEDECVLFRPEGMLEFVLNRASTILKDDVGKLTRAVQPRLDKITGKLPDRTLPERNILSAVIASGFVFFAFLWSYWHGIAELGSLLLKSDEYSAGLFVPFLAVYILWSRRQDIAECPVRPSVLGLFAFIAAQGVRLFGLFFKYGSAERLSIVLTIAALVLLLFGWRFFRKVSPILLFMCLMLPFPNVIQNYIGMRLQYWATSSAVFCLETIGYEVIQEGNIIKIGETSVAVAEACNGLRMITAFFVISGLVVLLLTKRAWWEKLIIMISSLPIALLCNTIRLTITAIFFTILEGEHWEKIFHDFGGYAMMPLALVAVVGELWLLNKLTTLPDEKEIIITRQRG